MTSGVAPRQILHVDLDAFFAAVEQRDNPSLRGKPVIVGGASRRGVVATASYEARKFGVGSAMSMVEALERCPKAIVVPPRREAYATASAAVFSVFRRFTPLVEGLSLDEAFLDVTDSQSLFGTGEQIAKAIKRGIHEATALTASAGVAPCKFVAKIASDLKKPDGLVVVREDEVLRFLAPLPIERMWGVGPVAAKRLRLLGVTNLGDLARAEPTLLESAIGSWGLEIQKLARGIDERRVEPLHEAKSIGSEETFEQDLTTREQIERALLAHSERVAERLVTSERCGRTVVVKIKYADFTLRSRRRRLESSVWDTDSIFDCAKALLDAFAPSGKGIRLVGVAVCDLCPGPPTAGLFPDPKSQKRAELQELQSRIVARFGRGKLTRARLLDED